jgi:hypothetical protein
VTPVQLAAAERAVIRALSECGIGVTSVVATSVVDAVERIAGSCPACAGAGVIPSGRYVRTRGYLHRPCELCQREREHEARYDAVSGIGAPRGGAA